ncbi:MAG TPA: hypothetical protein VFE23_22515 [Usitatibacter sp.]|nr:hypothetical protein [Usitatibacter sp.]
MATTLYLWISIHYDGRLAYDLQYDDVTYAVDAASRLDALRYGGLRSLLQGWAVMPPHSPFESLLAFAAFAVAGLNDRAMYGANVVILVFAAVIVAAITARNALPTFLLCLALVLLSPLAYAAIGEFRPDLMLGLATAAMAWTFVSAGIDDRPRRARLAGVLLGACLLIKPTFFAHTLALSAMLAGVSWAASWRIAPPFARPLALPIRELFLFLAIGLLISSPYYVFAFREIFDYFWTNTKGSQGRIWSFPSNGGPVDVFMRYIWPYFWYMQRRINFWVVIGGIPLFAIALAWRRQYRELLRVLALVAVGIASASIIMAGHQASPYFFTTMHWCGVLTLVSAIAALDFAVGPVARRWLRGLVALSLAAVVLADARNYHPDQMVPEARLGASWNQLIVDAIRNDLARMAPGRSVVPAAFVPTANGVNAVTLQWIGLKQAQPIIAREAQMISDLETLKILALESDYMVLPNPAREPWDRPLPVFPAQTPLLEWALANPDLTRLDKAGDEAKFLVFRSPTARRFAARGVPDIASGAIQEEYGLAGERYTAPRTATNSLPGYCFYLVPGHPATVDVRFTADRPVKVELRNARGVLASTTIAPGEAGRLTGRLTPVTPWNNCVRLPSAGRLTIQSFDVHASE